MGLAIKTARHFRFLRHCCIAAAVMLAAGASAAQAQMQMDGGHAPAERHRGGGNTLRDIGTGLAIGVIVGGAISEISKSSKPASKSKPAAKPKKKKKKAGKPSSRPRKQAAPETKPPAAGPPNEDPSGRPPETAAPVVPPVAPPVAPPVVPVRAVPESASGPQSEPCDECLDLWNRIRRYQKLIAQEQHELEDLERTKAQREAEGKDFRARAIHTSGQIEGDYQRQMADLADSFVKERNAQIESWKARIAREQAFLDDLLAQFKKCVERYCAKLAAEPEPAPPPVSAPAPVSTPPQGSTQPKPPPRSAPRFCPANANAAPVKEKLVQDYGANKPRPPSPTGRIFRLGNIPEEVAWFALFSFYNGKQGRTGALDLINVMINPPPPDATATGIPTDAVIVEGDVLEVVQQQDEVIQLNETAKKSLAFNAGDMFNRLRCGQSGLFTNRGNKVVMGNFSATRIHLTFGSFSVYWEAMCEIGPKRCCVPDSDCASGWRNETLYHCQMKWTMYDTYNFKQTSGTGGTGWLKRLNPLGWQGTPFLSFGYWDDVAGGILRQCVEQ